jgi:hypothetical protein
MQFDTPIRTIDDAKRYFQYMGCSHFHMCREYPERYAEYGTLGIGDDIELQWTAEEIDRLIEQLTKSGTDSAELWWIHLRITDLIAELKLSQFLERLLDATTAIERSLPKMDALLVAETIVGRKHVEYRPGLIFQSYDAVQRSTAIGFADQVRRLTKRKFKPEELKVRRQKLIAALLATEFLCGIRRC